MDRNACQQFFVHPATAEQRRYEVLRSVFVDEDSALDVAERFDLSHGTVRNWVSQFSAQLECGEPPPFSIATPHAGREMSRRMTRCPKSRTSASYAWNLAAVCARDWRGSFYSCRSWPDCGSIDS